jgi:hypothetical protein
MTASGYMQQAYHFPTDQTVIMLSGLVCTTAYSTWNRLLFKLKRMHRLSCHITLVFKL